MLKRFANPCAADSQCKERLTSRVTVKSQLSPTLLNCVGFFFVLDLPVTPIEVPV